MTVLPQLKAAPSIPSEVAVSLIDCDVHPITKSLDEIVPYLDEPWRTRYCAKADEVMAPSVVPAGDLLGLKANGDYEHVISRKLGIRMGYLPFGNGSRAGYKQFANGHRGDSYPPEGGPPGSSPTMLSQQLFVDAGVDYVFLLTQVFETGVNSELNAAYCTATNRWLADTWLTKYNAEKRFFGAISITFDNVAASVREIEEWAGHPGYRQILITHLSDRPLGHPMYEPIWEAAARHHLPVAMHFGGMGAEQSGYTPVGPFPHWVDYHSVSTPLAYSAHLVSWICSGVFDRLPDLRIVFVEGGFLWHRPLIARLARHWKQLASEMPVRESDPFEYIKRHVRFSSQPIEEAPSPRDAAALFELAGADRLLLFSTDYPHYDYDDPARALPPQLTPETRRRVRSENARELYRLPAMRPTDRYDLARLAR